MSASLLLGAVAYDPKVVTIWDGFKRWFADHDFGFDYVLYSHYERQVEDLAAGRTDVAWNSPLAWVRSRRLAPEARAMVMRDTDRNLTSVVVVRGDSDVTGVADLKGRTVATGAVDSPQGTLLPLALFDGVDVTVRRFEVGVGRHGDHVGGERDAARALAAGEVDAACMLDGHHLRFATEGTLPAHGTRIIAQTPPFDHCNMTVVGLPSTQVDGAVVVRGDAGDQRLAGATRAGTPSSVVEVPPPAWGLAPRGAVVEEGGPPLAGTDLDRRDTVWSDLAPKLYARPPPASGTRRPPWTGPCRPCRTTSRPPSYWS